MLNVNYKSIIGLFLLPEILLGCATVGSPPDPFEHINRRIFGFNEKVDKLAFKPIAEVYKAVAPEPINQGVTGFFSNLGDVPVIANDLLQLKFQQSALDTGRFLINSVLGLFGFVDVAAKVGLPKHYEDFGQTLGYWGISSGPYIVLPFFGPSSLRDTAGWGVDILLDPRTYYANAKDFKDATRWHTLLTTDAAKIIDARADLLGTEQIVDAAALDKYSYLRDAYLQRRHYLIYDGNPPQKANDFDEKELFDDLKTSPP